MKYWIISYFCIIVRFSPWMMNRLQMKPAMVTISHQNHSPFICPSIVSNVAWVSPISTSCVITPRWNITRRETRPWKNPCCCPAWSVPPQPLAMTAPFSNATFVRIFVLCVRWRSWVILRLTMVRRRSAEKLCAKFARKLFGGWPRRRCT